MSNIKQQLEAEAERIVSAHRDGGEGIHDLIAKHASERGYEPDVIRSLSWLINRHNFKMAMAHDRKDEIQLADAETVLHRMRAPGTKQATKSASLSPSRLDEKVGFESGSSYSAVKAVDYGPVMRRKLAAREMELTSQIKQLNASLRGDLEKMARLGESVKRAGLDASERFTSHVLGAAPSFEGELVGMVLENIKVAALPLTDAQFRMYAGRAIADATEMLAKAANVKTSNAELADALERLERVHAQMEDMKQGWEV